VQQLYAFCDLKAIPIPDKPSGTLELLEYVGLIRPLMLQRLIEIRNAVEHEDASPPRLEELHIFLEFVWYFLRSTDNALRHPIESFVLQPIPLDEDSPYSVGVTLGPHPKWIPKIRGWVEPEMVSIENKQGWLMLKNTETITRQEFTAKSQKLDPLTETILKDHGLDTRGKNPDDIHLEGEVRGPKETILRLIHISLRLI
jgi:hypothetical protein